MHRETISFDDVREHRPITGAQSIPSAAARSVRDRRHPRRMVRARLLRDFALRSILSLLGRLLRQPPRPTVRGPPLQRFTRCIATVGVNASVHPTEATKNRSRRTARPSTRQPRISGRRLTPNASSEAWPGRNADALTARGLESCSRDAASARSPALRPRTRSRNTRLLGSTFRPTHHRERAGPTRRRSASLVFASGGLRASDKLCLRKI